MAHQDKDLPKRIGEAILALRQRAGLSQAKLAVRMGLKPSAQTQLGRYERGERMPRADTLYRILEAAGGTLSDFEASFHLDTNRAPQKPSRRAQVLAQELLRISQGRDPGER